ncbi:hypothetical protein J4E00_12560 [Siccationidurans soli]|uniref:DUF2339 domain-containing protein n=1 Tax=Hymenobacter negativus TaxID=2795026 RepID=A0ABS3QF76_9BACT|nr:hypothetical protein [Hymenobacter negativus]
MVLVRNWGLPGRLTDLQKELAQRLADQKKLQEELQHLREQVAQLREAAPSRPLAEPVVVPKPTAPPVAVPLARPVTPAPPVEAPVARTASPAPPSPPAAQPEPTAPQPVAAPTPPVTPLPAPEPKPAPAPLPAPKPELAPLPKPPAPEPVSLPELSAPEPEPASLPKLPLPEPEPAPLPIAASIAVEKPVEQPASSAPPAPVLPPTVAPAPTPRPVPLPKPEPAPLPLAAAVAVAPPVAQPPIVPPVAPPPPAPPRRPPPPPVPTGPSWWERASTILLENWTGILGAVVLVTGVGFLGIYATLRMAPPFRFLMICAFSAGLLGARFALRNKEFARQLNGWLLSSAAAIFLFACVGSVSIAGLRWVTPPFDYLLLLAGVSANLWLAWRSSRQEVSTLHGVLSLVALAVLPPTALTLAAAAGVTAFSIAITYRQQWKYQLLLSIVSFFAFHLYWHQELAAISSTLRLVAMGLVLLVGVAAAVVQYRRVYAKRTFEPLLFAAHLLNWTCLGINLYLYSTGSIWKTIPLAAGALLTFWAGRKAKQLGIGWLFQTDTIISLMLALATAFSLQGWHATNSVILLFMLLESLLVALIMARQSEALVYRVAMSGAGLAATGLLLLAGSKLNLSPPHSLYRDAFVLALAGWAGLAFVRFIFKQPLLNLPASPTPRRNASPETSHRNLLSTFAGVAGLLQAGAGILLARVLFAWAGAPVGLLIGAVLGLAGAALGIAAWLRTDNRIPEWIRQQQLLLAQFFALLAVFGLHETGLSWPVLLGLLYAENLVVALVAGRWRETLLYQTALAGASLAGASLLLVAAGKASAGLPPELYRDALVLALAGWAGILFTRLALRQLLARALANSTEAEQNSNGPRAAEGTWLGGLAGLAGLLQVGAGLLLARVVFGWQDVPVWLLLAALLSLAGAALGLAAWLRTSTYVPAWVRQQQLILGQFFIALAVLGLHETGLNWPVVLGLLYAENLAAALLSTRQREPLLYRLTLTSAYLTGATVLLATTGKMADIAPALLYRDACVLALTGWLGIAFVRVAHAQLTLLIADDASQSPQSTSGFVFNDGSWLSGFAGLAGLLQVGAGLLLVRAIFAWEHVPVALLIGALLGLAGAALVLAGWLRTSPLVPAWVRQQQLVLAQFFTVLAVLGMHELHLSWPIVLGLLYFENLAVALLTARRRELLLYHIALTGAYATGAGLLLLAANAMSNSQPPVLYRDALILALTGWAGIIFVQLAHRQLLRPTSNQQNIDPEISSTDRDLLSGFAALGGLLQVGTGALVACVVFGWQHAPVGWLLLALVALAGIALSLAGWVRAQGYSPSWVRRQQLVLGQFFAVLAVLGLHEMGLTWPAVFLILYAENLLAALLLNGRNEETLLHVQTYLLLVLATLLPFLVRYATPETLGLVSRAALLAGGALLTVAYQLRHYFLPKADEEFSVIRFSTTLQLPALGLETGWLLLNAGALVYEQSWAAWVMVGLLGSQLLLRQRLTVPGLWAGLVLAGVGYIGLQWSHVLAPPPGQHFSPGYVLFYILPTVALPVAALGTSWWAAANRYLRWPWLYLLALHLVVALMAAVPKGHIAYLMLGLLTLAVAAFAAAQIWRRILPNEAAVQRAGTPDRFLLHVAYWLLACSVATHLWLITLNETFFGQPAEYFTAAALFAALSAFTLSPPPATAPVYNSWRILHPWLPEATLLFGTATLWHNIRTPWLPLVWILAALALSYSAARIPIRLRRLGVYGRLYYWLAAGTTCVASLLYISPAQLLSPEWWEVAAAVTLLFGYVGMALQAGTAPYAGLSPAWDALARPPRRVLEAWLLYPAFLALALLLIQSFDRSVLTVLLMVEVVVVFSTSLLLRRQDLRYLSLTGMLACLVRLVFFDLSQSGTVTRAVVFILMGLLLLGMNALYARFKSRFTPDEEPNRVSDEEDIAPEPTG